MHEQTRCEFSMDELDVLQDLVGKKFTVHAVDENSLDSVEQCTDACVLINPDCNLMMECLRTYAQHKSRTRT